MINGCIQLTACACVSVWPAGLCLLRPALAGWPVSAWSVAAAGAALVCLCASVPPRLCLRASQIDNKLRRETFTNRRHAAGAHDPSPYLHTHIQGTSS